MEDLEQMKGVNPEFNEKFEKLSLEEARTTARNLALLFLDSMYMISRVEGYYKTVAEQSEDAEEAAKSEDITEGEAKLANALAKALAIGAADCWNGVCDLYHELGVLDNRASFPFNLDALEKEISNDEVFEKTLKVLEERFDIEAEIKPKSSDEPFIHKKSEK